MTLDEMDDEYAKMFPPLITLKQAAEIAHRPLGTIYEWSSQGRFDSFKHKPGRIALLSRKDFLDFLLSAESHN